MASCPSFRNFLSSWSNLRSKSILRTIVAMSVAQSRDSLPYTQGPNRRRATRYTSANVITQEIDTRSECCSFDGVAVSVVRYGVGRPCGSLVVVSREASSIAVQLEPKKNRGHIEKDLARASSISEQSHTYLVARFKS